MNYMIDNGIKSENLPINALTQEEAFKCVVRHLVTCMDFRIFKDLDKMYKTKVTSRSLKITATKGRSKKLGEAQTAKDYLLQKDTDDFDLFEAVITIAENTVKQIIVRNKTSKDKILEDIETESGRKKLFLLSTYALGEAVIEKFGEFKHSRTMENFINTRKMNEVKLREIFKQNSWSDAVELFQELLEKNEKAMISVESNDELVEEIVLYNMIKKQDILEFIYDAADQIRENITGQLRIDLK